MNPLLTNDLLRDEIGEGQGLAQARERNLFEFAQIVWRHRRLALTIMGIAIGGAIGVIIVSPEEYTAQAILQLDTSNTEFADFNAVVSQQDVDELAVGSEIHVLASYPVALRVVDQLGLTNDPEFNPLLRDKSFSELGEEILSELGEEIQYFLSGLFDYVVHGQAEIEEAPPEGVTNRATDDPKKSQTETFEAVHGAGNESVPAVPTSGNLPGKNRQDPLVAIQDGERDKAAADHINEVTRTSVAANLLENISVWNEGRSYTIFASFRSEDRVKAANIVNAFAENYLARQLESNSETTEKVSLWLSRRLNQVRQQVRAAEAKIEAFRENNQLVDVGASGSLAGQQLNQINQQIAETSVKRSELEARSARARGQLKANAPYSIPEVLSSPVIQQLRSEATTLERRRVELALTFGSNHPTMIALQAELEKLERKLDNEVENIVNGLAAELNVILARESKLSESSGKLKGAVGDVDRANARLGELKRDAEASQVLFLGLAKRYEETLALQDAQQAYAHLVAPAVPPIKPSHPNKVAVLGVSLVLGGALTMILITVLEYRGRERLRTTAQLEQLFGLPCHGILPEFDGGKGKRWFNRFRRPDEEGQNVQGRAIRRIKNAMWRSMPDKKPRLVMVTSSLPSEGKSTLSTGLAHSFADAGQKTLVVDADIHRPSLRKILELDPTSTETNKPGHHAVWNSNGKLSVLLLAEMPRIKSIGPELDENDYPVLYELIQEAAADYDVVVVDTPPVVLTDDATILMRLADSIIYLVRWNETPNEAVQAGLIRMRNASARQPIGLVLSRVDLAKHARYGYKDESYFSKQYGSYYSTS